MQFEKKLTCIKCICVCITTMEITLEFTKEHHRRDGMDSGLLVNCISDALFVLKEYYVPELKQAEANIELKKLFEMKDSVGDCQVSDIIGEYMFELELFCRKRDAEILKLREELEALSPEKIRQENEKLKKELDALKEFELDRILDASMSELF